MNRLSEARRSAVMVGLHQGKTMTEVATAAGVSKRTVRRIKWDYQERLASALNDLYDQLESIGIDPFRDELSAVPRLDILINCTCPLHPYAEPVDDVDLITFENQPRCRLCKSDGMRRRWARRRQSVAAAALRGT